MRSRRTGTGGEMGEQDGWGDQGGAGRERVVRPDASVDPAHGGEEPAAGTPERDASRRPGRDRDTDAYWRGLLDQAPIGLALLGSDTRVRYANAFLEELVGDRLEGSCLRAYCHPDDWQENEQAALSMWGRYATGIERPLQGQLRVQRPDGSEKSLLFTSWRHIGPEEDSWLTIMVDIATPNTYWRTLVAETAFGVAEVDAHGVVRYCNPAFDAIVGIEMTGRPIAELTSAVRDVDRAAWTKGHETDGRAEGEYRLVRPGGRQVWVHGHTLRHEDGGYLILLVDQSDSRAERDRFAKAHAVITGVLSTTRSGILVEDGSGALISINEAAVELFGSSSARAAVAGLENLGALDRGAILSGLEEPFAPEVTALMGAIRDAARGGDLIDTERQVVAVDGGHLELTYLTFVEGGRQGGGMWSVSDVSEREEAIKVGEAARLEAERLARAKDEFLAVVSHELRTPLHTVVALSDLLARSELAQGPEADKIRALGGASRSLAALVEDILDYTRAELGQLELGVEPFELREVVEAALALVGGRARDHAVSLASDVHDEVAQWVLGDARRLSQVLINLLTNAIESHDAEASGAVLLEVTAEGDEIRFAVQDQGAGLDPEELPRLTQPFARRDTSRAKTGVGLGLSIAHRLVSIMGGILTVVSVPGQGSTFAFTVTLVRCDSVDEVSGGDGAPGGSGAGAVGAARRASVGQLEHGVGGGRRALVVEDNSLNRIITTMQLAELGWSPEGVADGAAAIERLAGERWDLVLLDRGLPDMDGLDLARAVRAREAAQTGGRRTALVGLTAGALESDRVAGVAAGLDRYLAKPVSFEALAEAIDAALALGNGGPENHGSGPGAASR